MPLSQEWRSDSEKLSGEYHKAEAESDSEEGRLGLISHIGQLYNGDYLLKNLWWSPLRTSQVPVLQRTWLPSQYSQESSWGDG